MHPIELLAPAKTADIGIEAIRHGADAVYIGAHAYGARASAGNSVEDIERLVEFAYASDARLAMVPMQDLLGLDERNRMNTPGTVGFNWKWCLKPGYLMEVDVERLKELCVRYER